MEHTTLHNYTAEVKKLPGSKVEISVILTAEEFAKARPEAIKEIGKDVAIDGFRKGHVPEKVLLAKIGEAALLEEMAEIAISHAYAHIMVDKKIDALGRPEVRITKIAHGNPLEFVLTTAVFPEITLPDYKKLAAKEMKKEEAIIVTDEEVEKTVEEIKRMRAKNDAEKEGKELAEDAPLPELDDAFVATLGAFTSVDDLKTKLRENIHAEKSRQARDKKRVALMEAVIADTTIELPEIIVEQELHRMEDEFAHEISRMGMDFDAYLKATGKTHDDMHKEWKPDAEKRAKVQLITAKIAEVETIVPDAARLDEEVANLRAAYPDASEERVRDYLTMVLTNEKVFEFLEEQGKGA